MNSRAPATTITAPAARSIGTSQRRSERVRARNQLNATAATKNGSPSPTA